MTREQYMNLLRGNNIEGADFSRALAMFDQNQGLGSLPNTNQRLATNTIAVQPVPQAGGLGNYATISNGAGGLVGIDKSAYDSIQSAGGAGGLDVSRVNDNTTFGVDNDTWAGLGSAANLGLGIASYLDTKKLNKKKMAALDENIAGARQERNATQNYRQSYGLV